MKSRLTVSLLLALMCISMTSCSGRVGKAAGRSVARRFLGRSAERVAAERAAGRTAAKARASGSRILKWDRWRDSKLPVTRLTEPRKVFRFTTSEQAELYRRRGVPSGTHFTVKAGPGRPPTALHARERYGLPATPSARVEAELPGGTKVKVGKVVGGQPGYGELRTYRQPLPSWTVKNVTPLRK